MHYGMAHTRARGPATYTDDLLKELAQVFREHRRVDQDAAKDHAETVLRRNQDTRRVTENLSARPADLVAERDEEWAWLHPRVWWVIE